jgi:guanylate kinase
VSVQTSISHHFAFPPPNRYPPRMVPKQSPSHAKKSAAAEGGTPGKHGKLVVIIGPSGVGKSAIMAALRKTHKEWHFPKSATTRSKRPGEKNDIYHFVTEEEFDELIRNDKVLEFATVHGAARYGTLVDEIIPFINKGITVVREVDVQGFESISRHVLFNTQEKNAPYHLQSIFIYPESVEQLIGHITKRSPVTEDELKARMHSMEKELAFAEQCDHKVINKEGELKNTINTVENLITKS